ncbi:hypothetical protein ABPG75_012665 [Micractinium tetrahymenae]
MGEPGGPVVGLERPADWQPMAQNGVNGGLQQGELQHHALQLFERGCTGGAEGAEEVAETMLRLQQELPAEDFRVLRRALLQAADDNFAAGNGLRPGVCQLLCELYLQEVVPETVLHDCLEQLLWDIRDPEFSDIECACAMLQAAGSDLDGSDLDDAQEIMNDFASRLQQLAASGVLPYKQHELVHAVLRRRAAGWAEPEAAQAAPEVPLPGKGGAGLAEAEDWRAVLDEKQRGGGAGGGVQDSARKEGRGAGGTEAAAEGGAGVEPGAAPAGAAQAAASAAPAEVSAEERKQQAVQQLLGALATQGGGEGGAAWDVAQLAQQAQQSALDLSTTADAERLLPPLLDAAAAAAAASTGIDSAITAQQLPAAIDSCAALVSQLSEEFPPVGLAATAHLLQAFKQRAQARSPAARQQLCQQMLLAGALALRGALAEGQLQGLLEQLARQVMKPSASDVTCLCGLLRGAGRASESKKGGWWKAAAQLAGSPNVSPDQQRELQHLLLLREAKWDAAAAAAAAAELEARSKAEAAAAALAEATLQRQAQEEAAKRAAAEVAAAEEKVKAAAARLAELENAAAAAQATAQAAQRAQQQAESQAASAQTRRAENDRAAAAAKKQAAEALAVADRARQEAASAAALPAAGGGAGGAAEAGRHWYYADLAAAGTYGPVTAAELLAWQYRDLMLGEEIQICRAHTETWRRLSDALPALMAELPPMPHRAGQPTAIPAMPAAASGRGGRGAGRGDGGRGGRSGRGSRGTAASGTEFPSELMPPPRSPPQYGGRGGRGRGGREAGRGGRGRGRADQAPYQQSYQQQQQQPPPAARAAAPPARPAYQQPPRPASPPSYGLEDMLPHVFVSAVEPAVPASASAPPSSGRGYNPMGQQQAQRTQQAAPSSVGLCPSCHSRQSDHVWLPCGHPGHCAECLPDYLSNEEKLANCPKCLVCQQAAHTYMRIYS